MVHHGNYEPTLRRLNMYMLNENVKPGRKRIFEKPSEIRRKKKIEITRKIRKNRIRRANL